MTEEMLKFYFTLLYRHITESERSFGELLDWASQRKLGDDTFLAILDQMEMSRIVRRSGEIYSKL